MVKTMDQIFEEIKSRVQVSSEATVQTNYKCTKCRDKGGYIETRTADVFDNGVFERDEPVWVECECMKIKKINRLMKSSQITEEFQKMTFENFHTEGYSPKVEKMYDTAFKYCQNFKGIQNTRSNSIAFLGQPGVGKTHLLSAVANGMITRLIVPTMYFPYVEGMEDLKSNFERLANKLQRLKTVDVLFIDDLFKPVSSPNTKNPLEPIKVPRATQWQVEKMFEVVNYRYLNNKPLLISSELGFDEMFAIDEALCTRIFEMCQDYIVTIDKDIKLNHRVKKMFNNA
ncbi:ATP-binding protein [Viridibacillus sp. NPDC096237]|uniref:ATP-binding protein n=1 Tax=Viridibacillus sp. NPDC096237 TaxID=3390721 RepID=UPI003D036144